MDDRHNNADPVMKQSLLQTEIRLLKKIKLRLNGTQHNMALHRKTLGPQNAGSSSISMCIHTTYPSPSRHISVLGFIGKTSPRWADSLVTWKPMITPSFLSPTSVTTMARYRACSVHVSSLIACNKRKITILMWDECSTCQHLALEGKTYTGDIYICIRMDTCVHTYFSPFCYKF